MAVKQVGALAIAFAAGFLVLWMANPQDRLQPLEAKPVVAPLPVRAPESVPAPSRVVLNDEEALRASYEKQIARLESELEEIRRDIESGTGMKADGAASNMRDVRKRQVDMGALRQIAYREARRRETDSLVAAGFTVERVEWIRKRSAELAADYERKEKERQAQGIYNTDVPMAHSADSDIDLRREVGDDEYARYRQALGRPIGLKISELTPGGSGESAGLKPGDEIVSYHATRVFNVGDINPLIRQHASSGASIPVDVLRDGKMIRLNVSGGNLMYRTPAKVMNVDERAKLLEYSDKMLAERVSARDEAR